MKIQSKYLRKEETGIISFEMPFRNDSKVKEAMITGYGKFALSNDAVEKEEDEADFEDFKRVDLIFYSVNEMDDSYEVSIFINNVEANKGTNKSLDSGYAGEFSIFGHGGCYGGYGHCETPTIKGKYNPHIEHPSAKPNVINVEVTAQLRRALANETDDKISITLVPSCPHLLEKGDEIAAESFKRPKKIELVFYN